MKDLWEPYKPSRYYFEVVECGRRIALTGLAVFIYPGSAAQVAIEVVLAALLAALFESLAPFTDPLDAWLSIRYVGDLPLHVLGIAAESGRFGRGQPEPRVPLQSAYRCQRGNECSS